MANPTTLVIWLALAASLFIYAGVAFFATSGRHAGGIDPTLMTALLAAVAVATGVGSILYRRLALIGPIQRGELNPARSEDYQRGLQHLIVNLALCESVGVYGLVLALLSGEAVRAFPFLAGALALLYVHRPSAPDLQGARPLADRGEDPTPIA